MDRSSAGSPQVFKTIKEFRDWRRSVRGSLGFIATMGALHAGHLSLISRARELNDNLVVSIFVNPLQFGPKEDFGSYPRTFETDLELCRKLGVDTIFSPGTEEIYPDGKDHCTKVVPPPFLGEVLEGHFRPGFFTGVATVVSKLFEIIEPNMTIFGEKDYQQLLVVKRMVRDLNMPLLVEGGPTIRADDGLALSSRNAYLTEEQRKIAPMIHRILSDVIGQFKSEPNKLTALVEKGKQQFSKTASIDLQYLEVRDANTLEEVAAFDRKVVLLTAAKIGSVRLIDNLIATP
ncbi:MAG: pantoate--beta-alanine ligase [Candidatus Melainabacteria bacterium]|nr:MAG: pantoate--beta-alanine ligase [Candidatus Melainabacteria bacterium]